jgi:dihydrofolate reductase
VLRGDPIEEVRALKAMPGDLDITATGSMQLVTALVASGLVDEYRLFVYPFVAGEGQRLFADATELGALRLVEAQSYRSGVVQLRYRP